MREIALARALSLTLLDLLHLPLTAVYDRSTLQTNIVSSNSPARTFTLENAARPIGQHHPQRQAAFAHRAVRDLYGIVEFAAHHRACAALIGTFSSRTLLGHCQCDIHDRVAAGALHLQIAAFVDRGPFPQPVTPEPWAVRYELPKNASFCAVTAHAWAASRNSTTMNHNTWFRPVQLDLPLLKAVARVCRWSQDLLAGDLQSVGDVARREGAAGRCGES